MFYDDGQLHTATRGASSWTLQYNHRGLLTDETLVIDGKSFHLGYGYDAEGDRDTLAYPSGRTISLAPDGLGRPTQAGVYADNIGYEPSGLLSALTYGNGVTLDRSANTRGLIASTRYRDGFTYLANRTLSWDRNGNLASISDSARMPSAVSSARRFCVCGHERRSSSSASAPPVAIAEVPLKHPWLSLVTALLTGGVVSAVAGSPELVYLNPCTGGCTLAPGDDDAASGTSSLVDTTAFLSAFPFPVETMDSIGACVRGLLLPYNVRVTLSDPDTRPRREVMLTAASSTQMGLPDGLWGVAPFDGAAHDNRIAVVFAAEIGDDVDRICWVAAEQIGFLYGLDYVDYCADIMDGSLTTCGAKSFTNHDSVCTGVNGTPGRCILGNETQNSASLLAQRAGPSDTIFANGLEAFEVPAAAPEP